MTTENKAKIFASPVARFDRFCTYHRIATLGVFSGEDGLHTVEITVDKDQPSRQPVASILKNPAVELAKPKYQGTKFWPAKIMLVGDIVADYGIWSNESR